MKIKARELEGAELDWAVAQVTGVELDIIEMPSGPPHIGLKGRTPDGWPRAYSPSTDWNQGGPLIEQNDVTLSPNIGDQYGAHERWHALVPTSATSGRSAMGPTPLVAAMRALVFARLGDEVEIPDELAPS